MEIIELHTYTKSQKMGIAKNHLIPKQLKRHGLNKRTLKITDEALSDVIDCYTRESGVRNLERELASLCRKAAKRIIEDGVTKVTVTPDDLKAFLGPKKIIPESISVCDEVGVVNGMAYTQSGGDLLKVECAIMDGTGKLELTGSLGDVMKESAHAAITYARQVASEYGISPDFYAKKDIHIHFPEGAVPKDGPSAGITTLTALISALSGIPVRRDISMTGEITIRGNVLPIGGLREKTMAAYSAGVRTIIIPADNLKDLHEVDPVVRENVTFIPCRRAHEVLANALVRESEAIKPTSAEKTDAQNVVVNAPTTNAQTERLAKTEG
jgi:ATP-dependent Lon protease